MANNLWQGDTSTDPAVVTNWSLGSLPANTEDIFVPAGNGVAIIGGDLTTGATINSLTIEEGYTLAVGTAPASGANPVYLQFDLNSGSKLATLAGSGKTFLELSNATEIRVLRAGSTAAAGEQMLYLTGTSNALINIQCEAGDKVALAGFAGETAAFTKINVRGGDVFIGSGVTATTLNVYGGRVENWASIANLNMYGGSVDGFGAHGTAVILRAGTLYYRSSTTITAASVYGGAVLDLSRDPTDRTIGTLNLHKGSSFFDPHKSAGSVVPRLNACDDTEVTTNLGKNISLTRANL